MSFISAITLALTAVVAAQDILILPSTVEPVFITGNPINGVEISPSVSLPAITLGNDGDGLPEQSSFSTQGLPTQESLPTQSISTQENFSSQDLPTNLFPTLPTSTELSILSTTVVNSTALLAGPTSVSITTITRKTLTEEFIFEETASTIRQWPRALTLRMTVGHGTKI